MTALLDVFEAALTLPRAQRADLAHQLVVSIDEHFDPPQVVEAEWNTEILRRLAAIDSGETVPLSADEAREQLER
ncbi:MAG: addiction module protein [Actinomycetia bacterium]|nr:addiction module protein [Actinomycetes bacterium]